MSYTSDNSIKSAFPIFDMMLQIQQIGLRAMTIYQPAVAAMLDTTRALDRGTRLPMRGRMRDATEIHETAQERVIPVGEEVLNVGTRMVPGKTTRVRRVVVEAPVQQDVTLHSETVVIEHRKPLQATSEGILTEVTIEMSASDEVPVVSKSVRLVEEILLRKEVTARIETIHDTVKRDTLEIEQPSQLPVLFNAAQAQDQKSREERRTVDPQDKKPTVAAASTEQKSATDHKPPTPAAHADQKTAYHPADQKRG